MTDNTAPAPRNAATSVAHTPLTNKPAARALGLAIASLFFGLSVPIPVWGLFMLFIAAPLGIAAAISGHSALTVSRASASGRRKAQTTLVLAYCSLAICFFTTLFWIIQMTVSR